MKKKELPEFTEAGLDAVEKELFFIKRQNKVLIPNRVLMILFSVPLYAFLASFVCRYVVGFNDFRGSSNISLIAEIQYKFDELYLGLGQIMRFAVPVIAFFVVSFVALSLLAVLFFIGMLIELKLVKGKFCKITEDQDNLNRIKELREKADKLFPKFSLPLFVEEHEIVFFPYVLITNAIIIYFFLIVQSNGKLVINLDLLIYLVISLVVSVIPVLIYFWGVCNLVDGTYEIMVEKKLEKQQKLLDSWYYELDPEMYEQERKAKAKPSRDGFLTSISRVMAQEKAESEKHAQAMKEWEKWV